MPEKRIYLDYAASSYVRKEVQEAMMPYFLEKFGNPSSIHLWGQEAKGAIEMARESVAALIGAQAEEIVFTSSGTEGNNLALLGLQDLGSHLIVSKIEHPSVLASCKVLEKKGFSVSYLPVDRYGRVDLEALQKEISQKTFLVSIMHANNEVGTIQPLLEIGKILREKEKSLGKKIYFHTDAVQSAGIFPIDVNLLGVDLLTLSSHKLYGPKGVGALYVRKDTPLKALLHGGHQEKKMRASTENVAGIVGFAKACQIAIEERASFSLRVQSLRDSLYEGLHKNISELLLNGHPTERLPNYLNVSVRYVEGESLILSLSQVGIAASTGSACSSHSLEPSHVLLAMGLSHEEAHGSIRMTLGRTTTQEEIDEVVLQLSKIVKKLRNISPLGR